jgi:hypothetical protein
MAGRLTVEIAGEVRAVPPELMANPKLVEFMKMLTSKTDMDPLQAREYTEALIEATLGEVGSRYVKDMQTHFDAIMGTREQLKASYREVVRLGKAGQLKNLPAGLQAGEFLKLYTKLIKEIEAIASPADYVKNEKGLNVQLEDLRAAEEAQAPKEPAGPVPDLPLRRTGDPVWDPAKTPEQNQVELDATLAELQAQGEDGAARLRAVRAADRFRARFLGRDYKVSVRLTQRTSAGRAQAHGLRSFDTDLAGAGYEMVIERNGVTISPDGVEIQGDRFRFLEWKEPLGPKSESFYGSPEGITELRDAMVKRARNASQLPNCDGWWYEAALGKEKSWLNDLFADLIEDIGNDPATRDLKGFLNGPPRSRPRPADAPRPIWKAP